jgi:hypothetical protein
VLWNGVCRAEKACLRCERGDKRRLKHEFVLIRKTFVKKVPRCKRKHWFKIQNELIEYAGNSNEFWKKIGKIGVHSSKEKKIPMEVVDANGTIVRDHDIVLDRWKCEFESLLNTDSNKAIDVTRYDANVSDDVQSYMRFSQPITLEEVQDAIYMYNIKR